MQVSLLYKIQENTNIIVLVLVRSLFVVFVFNKTEFSQTNCHFFITKRKEFLKHKQSPLDVKLFFCSIGF